MVSKKPTAVRKGDRRASKPVPPWELPTTPTRWIVKDAKREAPRLNSFQADAVRDALRKRVLHRRPYGPDAAIPDAGPGRLHNSLGEILLAAKVLELRDVSADMRLWGARDRRLFFVKLRQATAAIHRAQKALDQIGPDGHSFTTIGCVVGREQVAMTWADAESAIRLLKRDFDAGVAAFREGQAGAPGRHKATSLRSLLTALAWWWRLQGWRPTKNPNGAFVVTAKALAAGVRGQHPERRAKPLPDKSKFNFSALSECIERGELLAREGHPWPTG